MKVLEFIDLVVVGNGIENLILQGIMAPDPWGSRTLKLMVEHVADMSRLFSGISINLFNALLPKVSSVGIKHIQTNYKYTSINLLH